MRVSANIQRNTGLKQVLIFWGKIEILRCFFDFLENSLIFKQISRFIFS